MRSLRGHCLERLNPQEILRFPAKTQVGGLGGPGSHHTSLQDLLDHPMEGGMENVGSVMLSEHGQREGDLALCRILV